MIYPYFSRDQAVLSGFLVLSDPGLPHQYPLLCSLIVSITNKYISTCLHMYDLNIWKLAKRSKVLKKSILGLSMKLKTSIFKNGIRPNHMDPLKFSRGIAIILHYPKQIFRNKWWKNNWPTRNVNDSKNYIISYDVGGMEVVRYRNKRAQPCKEGFPDYDGNTFQEILRTVGCRPPYAKSQQNLTFCRNL